MYQIKEQFKNKNGMKLNGKAGYIKIDLEGDIIEVNTFDNSDMDFKTFAKLCKAGYSFIFDLSKKNKIN